SWGYAALGCAIEGASGLSYSEFLKAQVLDPAGMRDTTFDEPAYSALRFSPGFRLKSNTIVPSVVVDTRFKTPASGLISTVLDLTRFASALFGGSLLSASSLTEMQAVPAVPAGETPRFTAGWTLGQQGLGAAAYEYNGSMEGTTAYLVVVPERKIAVALLANRERFVREIYPIVSGVVKAAIAPAGR
ncbi:MAG: serine hydrolase domain-containing protein, partial [Vicinamibacterales bacterium]